MSSLILLGAWYDGIMRSINGFLTNVVGLVYKFAAYALRIFLILANGKLIDSDKYSTLINNFYIIIGIVMLFLLAFALLRGMINPDDKKQGTEMVKKVILNLVTSTLIIAVLPTIFAFAFDFQNSVLIKQNTIGRLFGYGGNGGVDLAVDQGANQLANGVFTAFFNVDQAMCDEGDTLEECQAKVLDDDNNPLLLVMQVVDSTGQFGLYANFQEEIGQKIEHNWLLNLIAGIFLSYVAISFCFDMAIRMIKLIFYQIIAPIPVFLRVVPDGKLSGTFNQWVKVTLTCYLEVYIRILVFYFCIYLFNSLFGSDGYGADVFGFLSGTAYGVGLFVKAFVIMGIVMFMKQAPKLISEITGIDSGNMKLGIKDKLKDGGFFAAGAALGAGATTMTRNATNAWRNFNKADGFKGKAKAAAAGVGSIFAGGVSGTFRGGRAGMSAKSFGDMKNAAGKGAKGATDARNKREAYRVQHSGENLAKAKWEDYVQNAKEWAVGGFEAEEAKLKAYNELLSTQDSAKAATEKILNKYSTRAELTAMPSSPFKGVASHYNDEFRKLFTGQSLSTMENTINSMKSQKIEREQTWDSRRGRWILESDESFAERVRNYNERVAAYDAMYQQVRKESIKNLQSLAFDKDAYEAVNLQEKDILGIKAEVTKAQDQFNAMGMGTAMNIDTPYVRGTNTTPGKGAGYSFDTAAEIIEKERNKLSAEVARKKAARDARHQNDNH